MRIVDPGRQRAYRDFDQLADGKRDILRFRPLGPKHEDSVDACDQMALACAGG